MEAVLTDTEEACGGHKTPTDELKRTNKVKNILLEAIKKVNEVLIDTVIRLDLSSNSCSNSSFNDTDGEEVINMTDELGKLSLRQHVSKDHRGGWNRGEGYRNYLMSFDEGLEVLSPTTHNAHGYHQQHYRHMKSHSRPEIVEIKRRRLRSNSNDRASKSQRENKRKNKKYQSSMEISKHDSSVFRLPIDKLNDL